MDSTSEFVSGVPHSRLRPFVGDYSGYRIAGIAPGVHVGLPSRSLTFIVAFDQPVDIATETRGRDEFWAMLAGLHARPALIRHDGTQHRVQVEVTPAGAAALFDAPSNELVSQIVHVDSLMAETPEDLGGGARNGAGWHECLDRLAAVIGHTRLLRWGQRWHETHPAYVAAFGPEADALRAPTDWDADLPDDPYAPRFPQHPNPTRPWKERRTVSNDLQLTAPPTVRATMGIRRPSADVFDAFVDPKRSNGSGSPTPPDRSSPLRP